MSKIKKYNKEVEYKDIKYSKYKISVRHINLENSKASLITLRYNVDWMCWILRNGLNRLTSSELRVIADKMDELDDKH